MKRVPHTIDPRQWSPESPYIIGQAYTLHLGNRRVLRFTSKRLAGAYEADTKRWLKELILEGNLLLGQAMYDYREAWPTLSDTGSEEVNATDAQIRELLQQAVWHLDRATVRGTRASALLGVWADVERTFGRLGEAYRLLEQFWRYKTQGVLRYRMSTRARQCDEARDRMQEYGANVPQLDVAQPRAGGGGR